MRYLASLLFLLCFAVSVPAHPLGDTRDMANLMTPASRPGDADGNGVVDVVDVMTVVNKALGYSVSPFVEANADLNADGIIDIVDVMYIVHIVLHGDSSMGPGSVEDPNVDGK